jgi:hypothetical protein
MIGAWCAAAVCGSASSVWAQTDVFWLAPVSGLWSDAANWSSPFVPGQGGNTDVRAVVNLAGSYSIGLDFDATLSGLELSGAGAVLSLTGAGTTLETGGQNTFNGSSIVGNQSTAVRTFGSTSFAGSASFNNVGLVDLGGLTEFGDDDIDLCDTCVFLTGSGLWGGGGTFNLQNDGIGSEVVIETGASLALLGAGGRTIQGVGGGNRFINRGELRVALDGAGDAFEVAGSTFQNAAGGSVRVEAGTLRSDLNGTLSGTSLRGGDWFVGDGGAVDAVGRTITAINAAVELSGAGSSFAAIDSLSRVADRGTFRVTGGRDFQTDAGVAAFTVDGALEVGAGSSFGVTNALANLSAGTLSGGSFVVGGSLELAQGGSIAALEAALTLAGTGAVRDGSGGDLLASLAEIRDAGAFALRDGAVFTTAGDLALDGTLDIGRGSAADVRGDLSAFQGGVFGAADLRVRGDVIADNARVQAVEGRLVVGLGGRILARDGGGTVDGLSFLAEVRGGGSVELAEGRDLDLRATTNTVAVEGSLILGATGAGGPDALLGSVLQAGSVSFGETGALTSVIAGLDNFGRIEADAATLAPAGASGDGAALVLVVGEGYAASFGDRFLLIDAASITGTGFASLTVEGDLGGGLFFEQFADATGVGVVVVPGPGGAGVLLLGLSAAVSRGRSRTPNGPDRAATRAVGAGPL